ncbi:MAG: chemotaxis protein CheW [Steroidobacterales bacterium]
MLFLLFQLDQSRYALDARKVVEVLPLVNLMKLPQAPPGVAGIVNYRGVPVPALDLSQLMLGRPARQRLNTRIILVNYPDNVAGPHLLGLIAERATETVRREPSDFVASGVAVPFQGAVATDIRGLTQWIEVEQLLPASVRGLLFQQSVEH